VFEAAKEIGSSVLTIKRWEKKGLIPVKKVWSDKYKEKIRSYDEDDIKLLKWLKIMGGTKRPNDFYLKFLVEYIETGKIDHKKLKWPTK